MSDTGQDYMRQGERLIAGDAVARQLGLTLIDLAPGRAILTMPVRADMLNFWQVCHGGMLSTFADIACALACNAAGELTVGSNLQIDYLAPAREGDVLTTRATEVSVAGRTAIYDAVVENQDGERIALMRARCRRQKGQASLADGG